jgi:hypothetical protein
MAEPSIRVVKSSPWKGGLREWSNRYYFTGGTPANNTAWETLFDNVVADEQQIYFSVTDIVKVLGYVAGSNIATHSKTYTTAGGSLVVSGTAWPQTLPVCALGRWTTGALSTRNHPIYAFSYWHSVLAEDTGTSDYDHLNVDQKAAMDSYTAAWVSGYSDGTHTLVRATNAGHTVTGGTCETMLFHRDFPYTPGL